LTAGKLNSYLADIDQQAEEMFFRLVKEFAEKEGITEALKAENQMLWVQRMNAVRETATEIVNNDLTPYFFKMGGHRRFRFQARRQLCPIHFSRDSTNGHKLESKVDYTRNSKYDTLLSVRHSIYRNDQTLKCTAALLLYSLYVQ
jgi:hypothetical protein